MTQRSAMIEPPQKLLPLCSIDTCHGARSMAISSPPMILLAADIKNYSFRIILKISIHFLLHLLGPHTTAEMITQNNKVLFADIVRFSFLLESEVLIPKAEAEKSFKSNFLCMRFSLFLIQ